MRADCMVWVRFLTKPTSVCRPFIDFSNTLTAKILDFYTDAPKAWNKGFRCTFGKEWTWGTWEPNLITELNPSTKFLELYAVAVAIEL